MTDAVAGIGTTVVIDGNTIDGVISLQGPDTSAEQIEVSSLDSDAYKEFISGFINAGNVAFEAYWSASAAQVAMRTAFANRQTVSGTVTLNGGGSYSFTGMLDQFALGFGVDGGITVSINCVLSSISFGAGNAQVLSGGSASSLSVLVGGSSSPLSFA